MPRKSRPASSRGAASGTGSQTRYGSLPPGFTSAGEGRVCIVTNEFHGLFKNGGIGTANTGLALALAEAGFSVTVAFSSWSGLPGSEFRRVRDTYRKAGVDIELITETPAFPRPFDGPRRSSYAVYLYLRERKFDVVYFHDNCGRGFYPLLAKRTGAFPDAPKMFVVCHGPHEWVYEINAVRYYDLEPIVYAHLERRSVELADAVISPSRYLVDWMIDHGWKLPSDVFVEQNIVLPAGNAPAVTQDKGGKIEELVFFGRTEARKGIVLFCDAIDRLQKETDLSQLRITFLGKFSRIEGMHSGIYILERSRNWSCAVRILAKHSQEQALDYLMRSHALAVIPSAAENSPCVVAECLQLGIPFVATDSGGTAELIAPQDREACLVAPSPQALSEKLRRALESGQAPARMAIERAVTTDRWVNFTPVGQAPAPPPVIDASPLVTVCLVDAGGETPALESILAQTYPNLEIVVADTAGARAGAGTPGTTVIDCTGKGAAGARNLAAGAARGSYLLFLDDTVSLSPDCIERLVRAAVRAPASLVTAFPLPVERRTGAASPDIVADLPLGACLEIGLVQNCFGDSVVLVERSAFDAIGGFADFNDDIPGFWQFLAAAVVAGHVLEVLPLPLFEIGERPVASVTDVLKNARATLSVFRDQPVALLDKLLEKFIDTDAGQKARLEGLVGNLDGRSGDIVGRLSQLEPDSAEALDGFLTYCIERGQVDTALEFAFNNGISASPLIRWIKKETVFEFDWTSSRPWTLEVLLGQPAGADQLRRIRAFVGEQEVAIEHETVGGNRTQLLIHGTRPSRKTTAISVRLQMPGVQRASGQSADHGFTIDKMTIRLAQAPALGDAAGQPPIEQASTTAPDSGAPEQRWEIAVGEADALVAAEALRLDDNFSNGQYRHLDLSLVSLSARGEIWGAVKFKFCWSGSDNHLEFRDAPGWPSMFIEFPTEDRDDYGLVMRLSRTGVGGVAKWTFDRDRMLLVAILTILPAAIALAAERANLSVSATDSWLAEANRFSQQFLRDLRQARVVEAGMADAVP